MQKLWRNFKSETMQNLTKNKAITLKSKRSHPKKMPYKASSRVKDFGLLKAESHFRL